MKKYIYSGAFLFICLNVFSLTGCGKTSYLEQRDNVLPEEELISDGTDVSETETETIEDTCFVQVSGAVNSPGVYQVSSEARLYEVIELAGGLSADADDRDINQAEKVHDGQKIYVYTHDERATSDMAGETDHGDGRVNINTASREELMTLPGIGEAKADAIISYRESYGQFEEPSDIMEIPGIKDGVYSKICDLIKVY